MNRYTPENKNITSKPQRINNVEPNAKDRAKLKSTYFYAMDVDKCPRIDHKTEGNMKYFIKSFFDRRWKPNLNPSFVLGIKHNL